MLDKVNIEDKIELYVNGKLTEPSLSEFKLQLNNDKSLSNEVAFQKLAIGAVKESRKLALKARLQSINVGLIDSGSTVSTSTMSKLLTFKSAAVVVATIGVGLSAYYFTQSQIEIANSNLSKNQLLIQDSITPSLESSTTESNSSIAMVETKPSLEISADVEESKEVKKTDIKKPTKSKTRNTALVNGEQMLDQKFDEGSEGEVVAQVPHTPTNSLVEEKSLHASDLDIKNVQDGKYNFHYMLKESTLFLFGNFDASPYEILEFNEKDEQTFFLYYDQTFFTLKQGQTEPMKLKKITDPKFIQELIAARNKNH